MKTKRNKRIEKLSFMQTITRSNDAFVDDTCVALQRIKDKINEIVDYLNDTEDLLAEQKQKIIEEIEQYFSIQGKIVIPEDRWIILKQKLTK